jgi:hypothetical protein
MAIQYGLPDCMENGSQEIILRINIFHLTAIDRQRVGLVGINTRATG